MTCHFRGVKNSDYVAPEHMSGARRRRILSGALIGGRDSLYMVDDQHIDLDLSLLQF